MPATTPVTLTLKVQAPLAAIVAPVSTMLCDTATAVIVPLPHVPVSPLGVDTVNPAGKESEKATPLRAMDSLGLVIVKMSIVEPPSPMDAAANDMAMFGGVATIRVADAAVPVPPSVELIEPVLFR